jgi:Protein of unknown function
MPDGPTAGAAGGGVAIRRGRHRRPLVRLRFVRFSQSNPHRAGECRQFVLPPIGRRQRGDRCAAVAAATCSISVVEGDACRGMADQQYYSSLEALRKLEESLTGHFHDEAESPPPADEFHCLRSAPTFWWAPIAWLARFWPSRSHDVDMRMAFFLWWPRLRKFVFVGGTLGGLAALAVGALWWRLSSGPIELDMATPWLTVAIKENLGGGHEVEIGGTQLERDANGRTSLRIRDIVVRDLDGSIVASAPKAEVGISGLGLFTGRIRAERLSLVGAEMAVRIESDSRLTIFAGSNKRPFVTAAAGSTPIMAGSAFPSIRTAAAMPSAASGTEVRAGIDFASLLAWIESLDAGGLDGRDLAEIGLKGGNLTVDDERNGKQWTFSNIDLSVTRPKAGGIAVTLGSEAVERPWLMRTTITPAEKGRRIIDVEAQKVSAKDLILAARIGVDPYEPDLTLSGRIRADIGADGIPRMVDGRMIVDKGVIHDHEDPDAMIAIDRAELSLEWDPTRQALMMPFQILSGGNRMTLLAQADAPREAGDPWALRISGGTVVLGETNPLILNRIAVALRLDPKKQRIDIEQGELGNSDLAIALSGSFDFTSEDPRLALGVAGTRMSVAAMKRLWPVFCAPKVRSWVMDHVHGGTVERLVVATNAPWSTLRSSGPPVPEDGLAIEIVGHSADIRPVGGLPGIRDADVNVRISGRTATINVGRGNVEISPGRKLSVTNGVFEVPDTFPKAPPAKVRFRLDGSVPAAAELLSNERLREHSGAPLDPATSRGTLTAQVTLALPLKQDLAPGSSIYTINLDVLNFAAERMVMGQKVEAALLKVTANNHGYWIRGDVKLNGVPAALDYRKPRDADAEVRVQAALDENARSKLGVDLNSVLAGTVPVKLQGRVSSREGESRFSVEADLTQSKIDNLFPGWSKAQGRASRATFTVVCKPGTTRFEDLVLEAPGTSVKGTVEVDSSGEILAASFPVFQLSEGDKAALKADRTADGTLRLTMRGELFDGRGFLKSSLIGPASTKQKQKQDADVDLDLKLGTVVGFHGETLRGLDLRLSRRGSTITALALNGKLGRSTPLVGDLRGRGSTGRPVIFIETNDAGAFFRFSDIYPKIFGGEMWVALDPQSADRAPQEGILNIRDFAVRGETALDRVAGTPGQQPGGPPPGVDFSRLRVEFTRSLGRFTIRDGLVKGPLIGATVDGYVDYYHSEVRMRGTFVPLYSLNNMFGQIPIFGLFLGGSNEGLLGVTYEVVGPPNAPVLRVNPISAVAPGLLRKFFEFPSSNSPTQSYVDPARN